MSHGRREHQEWIPGRGWCWVEYSKLFRCECCGLIGHIKKIQYRTLLGYILCMGCWNALRILQRELDEIDELRRELLREIKNADKNR